MAGRKRRKLKLLDETVAGDERTTTEDGNERLELQTWSDLPVELLDLIMSGLPVEDNIRASAVCKRWHEVAVSVRAVNQSPWLMYFPKGSSLYEFYDPSERKIYHLELPELRGSRVLHTKDGWLLLYRHRNHCVFFFNPFTREMINLPRFELTSQGAAFSCAPTSTDCVVFTVTHEGPLVVAISTCHPGESEWTTVNHRNRLPFVSSFWDKLVFSNETFYCLSLTGWVGVYYLPRQAWKVLAVAPPRYPENFFAKHWWKGKFMTENNGDILIIYTSNDENPMVYKLDRSEMAWKELETLGGVTLFASFLSSHSGIGLPGIMTNSVYFPKVRFFGKRCISYSFGDCRYYPRKQQYNWEEEDPFENIWIQPPRGASSLF
ncbi:FBox/DUF295-Related 1 [Hibiscus trionum]|uniref:FBox/DUF295-Related 1 n=1 Tax=Hibiscus trionum TaxID=183268 RepID=A0A9W7IXW8_HIBTR|nr:FBox/DUF295-Related 1 [Hibiscus trionum]